MPSYDVAAACRGDHDEKACVAAQYAARSLVSDAWLSVTPAARAEYVATDRWNDYGLLWACVESHQNDAQGLAVMTRIVTRAPGPAPPASAGLVEFEQFGARWVAVRGPSEFPRALCG